MNSLPPYFIFFLLSFISLLWFYCLSILWILKNKSHHVNRGGAGNRHLVSVIIPFFNESRYISKKIQNLFESDSSNYDFEVIFVDGGSTDNSCDLIKKEIEGRPAFRLIQSPVQGKIHQLNFARKNLNANTTLVANTDMDTLVGKHALAELVKSLVADVSLGAAGAIVVPGYSSQLDRAFWDDQNFLRLSETHYHTASSLVAPLYVYRKECFEAFPDDCIADDLFVSFMCNRLGKKVLYHEGAVATELRGPENVRDFLRHKYRKAMANMRETYRFMPFIREYHPRWKFIFLNRMGQLMVAPFALLFFLVLSFSYLWIGNIISIGAVLGAVFLGLICAYVVVRKKNASSGNGAAIHLAIFSLLVTNVILILVHCTYPFTRQDSKYLRVG